MKTKQEHFDKETLDKLTDLAVFFHRYSFHEDSDGGWDGVKIFIDTATPWVYTNDDGKIICNDSPEMIKKIKAEETADHEERLRLIELMKWFRKKFYKRQRKIKNESNAAR